MRTDGHRHRVAAGRNPNATPEPGPDPRLGFTGRRQAAPGRRRCLEWGVCAGRV